MSSLSMLLVGFLALLHFYILYFEMFAWTTKGPKVFRSIPKELFEPTKVFAANQGLYNGFLAAGLTWALLINDSTWSVNVASFFSLCVLIAGIYGALTADKSIFWKQGLPALLALISLWL